MENIKNQLENHGWEELEENFFEFDGEDSYFTVSLHACTDSAIVEESYQYGQETHHFSIKEFLEFNKKFVY